MEDNLDFLGRDTFSPVNNPNPLDAMDTPDWGFAGSVINKFIPPDPVNFGSAGNRYYGGNSVNSALNNQDVANQLALKAVIDGSNPNPEIQGYSNPVDYNRNQVGYDRYYNHPKFSSLGFSPYRDNESLYNQNATWGDEYNRMIGQFGTLFTTGFTSSIESLGDLISGNPTKLFDESAGAYSKAAEIGMTSKGGPLGFINNTILNFGYTAGILSEIALEELILGAATVGSGGAAGSFAAARTAQNLGKLSRVGEMFTASRNIVRNIDRTDNARKFWTSAGQFLNPFENVVEAYADIKKLNSGANAVYRLDNLAKASTYFGAFYRDVRNINAALAESKLEGGMVRDEVYKELINDYRLANNFALPEGQDHQAILDQANKAGFETEFKNLPLIYFSNKIAFENILNGYRPMQRLLNEGTGIVGDELIKKTVKGVPQYFRKSFTDIFTLPFTDPKVALRSVLGKGTKYTMGNLTEGLQELAQETISDAYKNYYIETFRDPAFANSKFLNTSFSDAIDRQVFSSQGLETFMSGFLMGGLAGPFGKFAYKTLPNTFKRITDPAAYKKYKEEREQTIEKTRTSLNQAFKDPFNVFTKVDEGLITQKKIKKRMEDAAAKGNQLSFQDAKDEALFDLMDQQATATEKMSSLAQTGELDALADHIKKLGNLTDEEFKNAYGFAAEEKNKKVEETLDRITKFKSAFDFVNDRFGGNPYKPELYKKGSAEYVNEQVLYNAWNYSRSNVLYNMYAKDRAFERKQNLLSKALAAPVLRNMAASDINILFDEKMLDQELDVLQQELDVAGEVTDPVLKKQLKAKKDKLDKIKTYKAVYDNVLKKDGTYDMRKVKKLYGAFTDYLQYVKGLDPNQVLSDSSAEEMFKMLYDYRILNAREKILETNLNMLLDPVFFKNQASRLAKITKRNFEDLKQKVDVILEDHIDLLEKNEIIASAKNMGVIIDPDQLLEYFNTGKIPTIFYHEGVNGPIPKGSPLYMQLTMFFGLTEIVDNDK